MEHIGDAMVKRIEELGKKELIKEELSKKGSNFRVYAKIGKWATEWLHTFEHFSIDDERWNYSWHDDGSPVVFGSLLSLEFLLGEVNEHKPTDRQDLILVAKLVADLEWALENLTAVIVDDDGYPIEYL